MHVARVALKPAALASSPLPWALAIGGVILSACSLLFLVRNIGYGAADDVFFAFTGVLGLCCLAAAWLPERPSYAALPSA